MEFYDRTDQNRDNPNKMLDKERVKRISRFIEKNIKDTNFDHWLLIVADTEEHEDKDLNPFNVLSNGNLLQSQQMVGHALESINGQIKELIARAKHETQLSEGDQPGGNGSDSEDH